MIRNTLLRVANTISGCSGDRGHVGIYAKLKTHQFREKRRKFARRKGNMGSKKPLGDFEDGGCLIHLPNGNGELIKNTQGEIRKSKTN